MNRLGIVVEKDEKKEKRRREISEQREPQENWREGKSGGGL